MAKVEYKKEFFDRDYAMGEAYRRVWKYARRYWFRLFVGIVCGMLTAGTLVPFFQIVQPALQHVESHDSSIDALKSTAPQPHNTSATSASTLKPSTFTPHNAFEREIAKKSKLPGWYPTVEKWAVKCGIRLQDEQGGMGGALVLIVCVIVPLVASVRLLMMFLNH